MPPLTNRERAQAHEKLIANLYDGRQTKQSGGGDKEKGDVRGKPNQVRMGEILFECKTTGQPGRPSSTTLLKQFEKVSKEAAQEGRQPAMSLQYYVPDSINADKNGYVTFTLRLSTDDAEWIENSSWGELDGD